MPNVIVFQGSQTIANAEDSCARLCTALAGGDPVEIDLSQVTDVDLAFIQILVAARKSEMSCSLRNPSDPVIEAIGRAGLSMAGLLQGEGVQS